MSSALGFVKALRSILTLRCGVPFSIVVVGLLTLSASIVLIVGTCVPAGVGDIGLLHQHSKPAPLALFA